jgi:nitrite reductase/ring-hydroxylating ferredoxin subunit
MDNKWMRVCPEADLSEGEIRSFNIDGVTILLARQGDRIYSMEDTCSHDGAGLSDGDLVDGQIQCARHGGRFNLETGEATRMPAVMGIKTYNVKIKNGDIYISLEN